MYGTSTTVVDSESVVPLNPFNARGDSKKNFNIKKHKEADPAASASVCSTSSSDSILLVANENEQNLRIIENFEFVEQGIALEEGRATSRRLDSSDYRSRRFVPSGKPPSASTSSIRRERLGDHEHRSAFRGIVGPTKPAAKEAQRAQSHPLKRNESLCVGTNKDFESGQTEYLALLDNVDSDYGALGKSSLGSANIRSMAHRHFRSASPDKNNAERVNRLLHTCSSRHSEKPPPPPPSMQALASGARLPRRSTKHRRSTSDTPLSQPESLTVLGDDAVSISNDIRQKLTISPPISARNFAGVVVDLSKAGSLVGMRPTHRRGHSGSSWTGSVLTESSVVSIVSDIRKSSFFGGYNEMGEAEMHFPTESIQLSTDPGLKRGELLLTTISNDDYERYHQLAEDAQIESWSLDNPTGGHCICSQCYQCSAKRANLPDCQYVLAVEDDLYRRVVDEICHSKMLPCGLFFCGHHEDQGRPSIRMAIGMLIILFGVLGWFAFTMH